MKSDVMPSIVQMEPEVLKSLVAEVKETVAVGVITPKTKKPAFGVADLWNIRRSTKTAQARFRG